MDRPNKPQKIISVKRLTNVEKDSSEERILASIIKDKKGHSG